MRNKQMLKDIQSISKLQAWLYANENNKITVENGTGTKLELSMNEEGDMYAEYLCSFSNGVTCYNDMLSIPIWLGIIEQLQNQPANRPQNFTSRWEEILFEHAAIMALN